MSSIPGGPLILGADRRVSSLRFLLGGAGESRSSESSSESLEGLWRRFLLGGDGSRRRARSDDDGTAADLRGGSSRVRSTRLPESLAAALLEPALSKSPPLRGSLRERASCSSSSRCISSTDRLSRFVPPRARAPEAGDAICRAADPLDFGGMGIRWSAPGMVFALTGSLLEEAPSCRERAATRLARSMSVVSFSSRLCASFDGRTRPNSRSSFNRFRSSRVKNGFWPLCFERRDADDEPSLDVPVIRREFAVFGLVAVGCNRLVFFSVPPLMSLSSARFRSSSALC